MCDCDVMPHGASAAAPWAAARVRGCKYRSHRTAIALAWHACCLDSSTLSPAYRHGVCGLPVQGELDSFRFTSRDTARSSGRVVAVSNNRSEVHNVRKLRRLPWRLPKQNATADNAPRERADALEREREREREREEPGQPVAYIGGRYVYGQAPGAHGGPRRGFMRHRTTRAA